MKREFLPPPDEIMLPLWKAERWLDENDDPDDRAYFAEAAGHTMTRVNRDEVARMLESRHAELRLLATLELGRRTP